MKPTKLILDLVQFALIIALLVLSVATFGTRVPLLAKMGLNFFAVTSGSMEPTIQTGSLLQVGKYRLEDLKPGDIITYRVTNPENNQQSIVTHRIAKVDKQEKQEGDKKEVSYAFTTKGDANSEEDKYTVAPGDIIGLYKWHVPKLGHVSSFAQTPTGFVTTVIIPAAILIIWELVSLVMYFKRHFEKKSQDEMARLREELAAAKATNSEKSSKKRKHKDDE